VGFFSKLKRQMGTGGIEVELTVPNAAALGDPAVDVQVQIRSGDQPQRFEDVTVELILERTTQRRDSAFHHGDDHHHTGSQREVTRHTLASVALGESGIDANGVQNYTVTLPLDALGPAAQREPEFGDSTLANLAESLVSMAPGDVMDRYLIRAAVKLEGMRDPSDEHQINIIGAANQQGQGGFGFKLGS
jgi:hypothetical protein